MSEATEKLASVFDLAIRSSELGYLLTEAEILSLVDAFILSMIEEVANNDFKATANALAVAVLKEREKPEGAI